MTDDEGFIRWIVDRPVDDVPRLVYADWLDERGDPRGAYLRAEAEWVFTAKWAPPGAGVEGALAPALRGLARGLDPVWVARVSRPPVGVCADNVTLRKAEPPATPAALEALETRLRLWLPAELRALLLNRNGGEPDPSGYVPRGRRAGDADYLDWFYAAPAEPPPPAGERDPGRFERNRRDLEHATTVLNNGFVSRVTDAEAHRRWASGVREFVALAEVSSTFGMVAIGLSGRRANKVYAINRPVLVGASAPRLLTESLGRFIAMLTVSLKNR